MDKVQKYNSNVRILQEFLSNLGIINLSYLSRICSVEVQDRRFV